MLFHKVPSCHINPNFVIFETENKRGRAIFVFVLWLTPAEGPDILDPETAFPNPYGANLYPV